MAQGKSFDLAEELKANPPGRRGYASVFDHPRIQEWITELIRRKVAGDPISNLYIADILTRGAKAEGLDLTFTASNVTRYIRERMFRGR